MSKYCNLERYEEAQRCTECGAIFSGEHRVRAVCGVDRSPPVPRGGPGTELKRILARFGIKPSSTCKCNTRARVMDERGVAWCEENLETIVEWLKEESARRGIPFVKPAARMVVKRAIADARKHLAR